MNRVSTLVWLLMVVLSGFATFKAKYAVQDLEDQLHRVRKQTIAEQQEIRVLNAEWTYLTQPERLADLNRRFLALAPVTAKQLQRRVEDIPLRPPPIAETLPETPPETPPGALAAAAPPPATPARPPVVAAAFSPAIAAPPLRLATAGQSLPSLNALIAQIAEAR